MTTHHGIRCRDQPNTPTVPDGRKVVVAIGIDDYQRWGILANAVNDARGVLALFRRLGFEEPAPPLINEAATAAAIRRLIAADLPEQLREDDSLVLFFAGHGHTRTHDLHGATVEVGFIIPVDGDSADGDTSTWLELDAWLSDVALLPPRHILVILDSCHSGIALNLRRIRGNPSEELQSLLSRRSRRAITSALNNEQALDSGPVSGHSLFTGVLVRALQGDVEREWVTGSALAVHLQLRVRGYSGSKQTPSFGAFSLLDDQGDMVIPVLNGSRPASLPRPESTGAVPRPVVSRGGPWYRWWVVALAGLGPTVIAISALALCGVHTGAPRDGRDGGHLDGGSGDGPASSGSNTASDAAAGNEVSVQIEGGGESAAIDASIADVGLAAHDAARPPNDRPLRCHKVSTGGYALGAPSCSPPRTLQCGKADAATIENPSFSTLHCKELCVCP